MFPGRAPEDEDGFDRVLMEHCGFRRLSEAEAAQLSEEEIERLEEAYDVARAREILKAVREGRMELVSDQELTSRRQTSPYPANVKATSRPWGPLSARRHGTAASGSHTCKLLPVFGTARLGREATGRVAGPEEGLRVHPAGCGGGVRTKTS